MNRQLWQIFSLGAALLAASLSLAPARAGDASPTTRRSSYVPTPAEVLKKMQTGIVKVVVKLHGVPVATGAGFFINRDGLAVTSRQLVRGALMDPPMDLEFFSADKKIIKSFKVVNCDPLQGSDLCSFKLGYEPKIYFSVSPESLTSGESISVIGHPRGGDASITTGPVVKKGDGFEFAAPLSPGNQGGPVLDAHGLLLGIAAKYSSDQPVIRGILPAREINTHLNSTNLPIALQDARKAAQRQIARQMASRAADELEPAIGFSVRGKVVSEMKGLKDFVFKFDNKTMLVTLPEAFGGCAFNQRSQISMTYSCAAGDIAYFSLQRLPGKGHEQLLSRNKQLLYEVRPVDVVEDYIHADAWDTYETVLTSEERRAFFSVPSPAQCQNTRVTGLKNAVFSNAPGCRFNVLNDGEPGAHSTNVWLLKDRQLYAISVWTSNASMAEYYSRVAVLAVLSARWNKSIDAGVDARSLASDQVAPKPPPTYAIELPEPMGFMGPKMRSTGSPIDLYGKKVLAERFADGFVLAVSNQARVYLPPDFDDITKKSLNEVAQALEVKVQKETIELEATKFAGRAARLLTAFGKDKAGKPVIIISAAIFFDDQTFELTAVSNDKDPGEVFREFKNLMTAFKRK